jgi:aspartate/methionine/tyrosine aminotransferase
MYAFFRVSGIADSLEFCKRLVVEASVGLAPGSAFGDEGEGFIRWCFATDITRLETGLERFASVLAAMRR